MFVTSPSPENLHTLFEFVFKGFDALDFQVSNKQKQAVLLGPLKNPWQMKQLLHNYKNLCYSFYRNIWTMSWFSQPIPNLTRQL